MWFTEAYIKNIFVKLILKIFTFENSNGKGQNILPRPGGCTKLGLANISYKKQIFNFPRIATKCT
jgi:hypothetical protein